MLCRRRADCNLPGEGDLDLDYGLAIIFALFVWWFSTGAVLYVVGLPQRTFGVSMSVATLVAILAVAGLVVTSRDPSATGAYCAFTCGLLIWAWHEMSFLTGFLTGPRRVACPPASTGWSRFGLAVQTLLYHEVAILVTAVLLAALTWGEPNQVGVWTFLLLWIMRLSAKLNVFLGVPNLAEEFLPDSLAFLKTYFAKQPLNLLFPASVTLATIVTVLLVQEASAGVSGYEVTGYTLLATLLGLAVIEHWLLVLPIPSAALWGWGLKSRPPALPAEDTGEQITSKIWVKQETRVFRLSGR